VQGRDYQPHRFQDKTNPATNCVVNYCTVENRLRFTPSNMVIRPLFNTETTLIWYCDHSIMVLRPLKYGDTTEVTLVDMIKRKFIKSTKMNETN